MTGSNYLVNIVELQNVVTSATGLNPLDQLTYDINNLQQMVDFTQKRIFTNIISKFDATPIQVTDDINLSNVNLYQNGVLFSGSGVGGSGGTVNISSGGSAIILTSTTSISSSAISFNVGGRPVFSFDGQGRALYFDASGLGNRFWVSSATLVADQFRFGGAAAGAAVGKYLEATDTDGNATWSYVSTVTADGTGAMLGLSSSGIYIRTGTTGATVRDAGRIDSNRNWYLGQPALTGNADLQSGSNDFTVIGGKLRYQGGGIPTAGAFLVVTDSYGTVALSSIAAGPSSFVVGDQIQSGTLNVRTSAVSQLVTITSGYNELARFTSTGFLGLSNSSPQATLDVGGSAIIRSSLTVGPGTSGTDYVFTTADTSGKGVWGEPTRLFHSSGSNLNELRVNTSTNAISAVLNGLPILYFSTSKALLGITGPYTLDVSGTVTASYFSGRNSAKPISFILGPGGQEAMNIAAGTGNVGIGLSSGSNKFSVAGSGLFIGNLTVASNLIVQSNVTVNGGITTGSLVAGAIAGNGNGITNIQTYNVGFGSNQLNVFQTQTRADINTLQTSQSTLSTVVFSTINALNLNGGLSFFSTLSSYIVQASNSLSANIGLGAGAVVSSYSTCVGVAMIAQFSTLSSYIVTNTVQFSTLSSAILTTSLSDRAYASTIAFSTASTLITIGISTVLSTGFSVTGPLSLYNNVTLQNNAKFWLSSGSKVGIGYKFGQDLSGALDISGLIYSRGLRSIQSPFTLGVGTSTTAKLIAGGYSPSSGWRLNVVGDIDISGQLFRNGALYTLDGRPDPYWTHNGSNIFFNDGAVGIGVTSPVYPLDVAGRIRCFGVDVIQGPGPLVSTPQGQYVSPWQYQQSNIYYNLGGAAVGTGISSVPYGVFLDISGESRFRNGRTYMSTLGVNVPYGSTLSATAEIFGSLHVSTITVDSTGIFGGRVTARDFLSLSDQRYKSHIELLSNSIPLLQGIRGVRFSWKDSGTHDIGLIAQEVQEMIPEAVSGSFESGYTVAYDKVIPVLVEAVKSLHTRVDILERSMNEHR